MENLQSYKLISFINGYHIVIREDNTVCKKDVRLFYNNSFICIKKNKLIKDLINNYKDIIELNDFDFNNNPLKIIEIRYIKNRNFHNLNGYANVTLTNHFLKTLLRVYCIDGVLYSQYDFYRNIKVIKYQRYLKIKDLL